MHLVSLSPLASSTVSRASDNFSRNPCTKRVGIDFFVGGFLSGSL